MKRISIYFPCIIFKFKITEKNRHKMVECLIKLGYYAHIVDKISALTGSALSDAGVKKS